MAGEIGGTGGSYGQYKGLTLAEIERLFEACVQEGGRRGFAGALRVAREQLESRAPLGTHKAMTAIVGVLLAVTLAGTYFAPQRLWTVDVALGAIFLLSLGFVVRNRGTMREVDEQRERIVGMASDTLGRIAGAADFVPKELTREQELTLREIVKAAPGSGLERFLSS